MFSPELGVFIMPKPQKVALQTNQLLGALTPASRARIAPHLTPVKYKLGTVVCEAGGLLKHAYFPEGAVLSLLTVLENGSAIETANIGREGAFGLFAAMYSRVSFNRCLVQLEGDMVRCPIEYLQAEFNESEHVRNLFVSYSETLLSQIQQTVACNAMHTTEERMCRWLLMMHDRARGRSAALHARIPFPHAGRQSQIRDAGGAIAAIGRPHQLSQGEYPGSRSARPRTSSVRVLRDRKGAVRRVPEAAFDRGPGRYEIAGQELIA